MGNLVLARMPGQRIKIGDHITVTVARIDGRKVFLAVEAPKDVRVDREEVFDKRKAEKQCLTSTSNIA